MSKLTLNAYIEGVKEQVKEERGKRASEVEKSILEFVKASIEKKEPTTIKRISAALNKPTQQIHQVLKKAKTLKKVKVEEGSKSILVVPVELA